MVTLTEIATNRRSHALTKAVVLAGCLVALLAGAQPVGAAQTRDAAAAGVAHYPGALRATDDGWRRRYLDWEAAFRRGELSLDAGPVGSLLAGCCAADEGWTDRVALRLALAQRMAGGGRSSLRSRRPYSSPVPVGPYILCADPA